MKIHITATKETDQALWTADTVNKAMNEIKIKK